jgi:thiol:disulfide interchange protein
MVQTDDRATTKMPRALLIATVVLLAIRLVSIPFQMAQSHNYASPVNWTALDQFDPKSNTEQKPVIYEFCADWCEPCKRMDSSVFTNKEIAALIMKRFVAIKVRDRLKEDGRNTEIISSLEKKYHVFAFPTLVVVGSNGEAVATLVGSASALSTVHFLSRSVRAAR